MQNLHRILDFLLQTPSNTIPTHYNPPILSPSTDNKLFHIQRPTMGFSGFVKELEYPKLAGRSLGWSVVLVGFLPCFVVFCTFNFLESKRSSRQ